MLSTPLSYCKLSYMNSHRHTILFVSEDPEACRSARDVFVEDQDYRLINCETEQSASEKLNDIDCQLIICDEAAIANARKNFLVTERVRGPHTARIVFGQPGKADRAFKIARNCAAFLHLQQPLVDEQLSMVAKRALEMAELSRRHRILSRELKLSIDDNLFGGHKEETIKAPWSRFEKLIYVSPAMDTLCANARQAAATELPILIQGETGTGKELLARAVHYNSSRRESPMHVQNCGGIADEALHSELFGHVSGAFSGAISDRLGLFRAADGGTVFLDEISEVSPAFQVSLLRFLQEGEVKPLGSDSIRIADVRIIAASNQRLEKLVSEGKFRKDLYYRLKGFELDIPPLRDRVDDIPALAAYFLERASEINSKRIIGISREALDKLAIYDFPGNVRELEMEISRAAALAYNNSYILPKHFSSAISSLQHRKDVLAHIEADERTLKEIIEDMESQIVLRVLTRLKWNQSKAAESLGLSRVGIANKIKRYGLDQKDT